MVLAGRGAWPIRLPRLATRPMHGDEANQAVKAGVLWKPAIYRYDPDEHHGPSLYWLTLPVALAERRGRFRRHDRSPTTASCRSCSAWG